MRAKLFLAFVALSLLWGGAQGVYTSATNQKPTEATVSDYIKTKPNSKWLKLSGATLDMSAVSYASFLGVGKITEIYVPVFPSDQEPGKDMHILLATKDPVLLEIAEKTRNLDTEAKLKQMLSSHASDLHLKRDFEGLVRYGLEFKTDDKRALERENPNLMEDYVVIDEGKRPDLTTPGIMSLVGIALIAWVIKGFFSPRKTDHSALPPPLPLQGAENTTPPITPSPIHRHLQD